MPSCNDLYVFLFLSSFLSFRISVHFFLVKPILYQPLILLCDLIRLYMLFFLPGIPFSFYSSSDLQMFKLHLKSSQTQYVSLSFISQLSKYIMYIINIYIVIMHDIDIYITYIYLYTSQYINIDSTSTISLYDLHL